ncbi:MAG: biopolymer transporter ExbD [Planctomycetaceae bacterium]|jgi:biopolymer transport protein ExbD|nr:biopolymer transporter ExbD [Planctomycetaceae bacterium]
MRVTKQTSGGVLEGDLTPMIDMTFQLIAFFMVLINFTQSEQHEKIQLPDSELAKPPEGPVEFPITIHLTTEGNAIIGGNEIPIAALNPFLVKERQVLMSQNKLSKDATIVIRAHKEAQTGRVQELIQKCQDNTFEKFALRAKEDVGNNP